MHNTITVHAWTGAEEQENSGKTEKQEEMVYVTESGSVYHRKLGCRYLKVSIQQVAGSGISSMRNSYGKYAACESCSRGQKPREVSMSLRRETAIIIRKHAAD